MRARTGIPIGRWDPDAWTLGTRCHLQAFASPSSRASLHFRPVGSVACQPSHQNRIAATVINECVTIRLYLAASRRAVWAADRGSASTPASTGNDVPRCRNHADLTIRVALVSTSIPAKPGARSDACDPLYPVGAGGARGIMLRFRCEMSGDGLREPVALGTRENGALRGFAINRQVGGDRCGLIHHAGGIQFGGKDCSGLRLVFSLKRGARG